MPHDRSSSHDEPRIDTQPDGKEERRQTYNSSGLPVTRRDCLRLGATAATAAAGLSSTAGAEMSRHGISFERVLDGVDDLGLDPTGNQPVEGALGDAIQPGTLVELPPGEYLVTDYITVRNATNAGVRGTGTDPSDVRFVFPDGNQGAENPNNFTLFNVVVEKNFMFENFEIHQTDDKKTGANILAFVGDGLELHDVIWQGFNPVMKHASGVCLHARITTESGVGHVTGAKITDGGVMGTYPDRRMGVLMTPGHVGEIQFSGLDIRELGSTAIRGTKCSGAVRIEDSYFENNDNGSIRIGGGDHPSKQSYARNCTVVVDAARVEHLPSGEVYEHTDGIRIDSSLEGWTGALVDNCEVRFESLPSGQTQVRGAIARPTYGDHGGFTVRDTTLRINCPGVPAVSATRPGSNAATPHSVTLDNVHVTGTQTSNDGPAVFFIDDSDGSTVTDCCVSLPDTGLDGVRIDDSANCSVSSTDILVGGDATDFSGSNVDTTNISNDGACRVLGDGDLSHSVSVASTGDEGQVKYEFTVSGDVEKQSTANTGDTIDGSTVTGAVANGGSDAFDFSGEITDFSVLGGSTTDVTVYIDGEQSGYADSRHSLTVESVGSEDWTAYEFTATGDVSKTQYANSGDDVSGSTASGGVGGGWRDTYEFGGEVTDFTVTDGSAADVAVYVDGEKTSLADSADNQITVESVGSEDGVGYEFTVSGDLRKGENANSGDRVDGSTAVGSVGGGWYDTYKFGGEVTDFTVTDGRPANVDVYVNGDPTSLSTDDSHTLKIESVGSENGVAYEATVSGYLLKGDHAGGGDDVTDSTATGTVGGGWYDTYKFGGEVTDFTVTSGSTDDVAVYVDGQQIV